MSLAAVAELLPCLPSLICRILPHHHAVYQLTAPLMGMLSLFRWLDLLAEPAHPCAAGTRGACVCWAALLCSPMQ